MLHFYLRLEAIMLDLDREGHEGLADKIRDVMDQVWRSLSEDELAKLDDRILGLPG